MSTKKILKIFFVQCIFVCYNFFDMKTSLITIPAGLDLQYNRVIQSGDRFIYPHVKVKRLFTSRSRKKGLSQKSLLVSLAPVWNAFDSTTKNAWNLAGAECGLTGFKLFVQDTSVRIVNNISGYATPSTLYQSKVGKIAIESPAIGLTILQLHPQSYYVSRKVSGTRSQYEPKLVQENLSLPVDIAISYKSDLTALSDTPFIIASYSELNANESFYVDNNEGGMYCGNSFHNVNACYLKKCKFYIQTTEGYLPSGGVRAYLYASDNSSFCGIPTGSPLAVSDLVASSSLPFSRALVEFVFSGNERILLSANTNYVIVIKNMNDDGILIMWADTSSVVYEGQFVSSFDGSTWGGNENYIVACFYVYGTNTLSEIGEPSAKFYITVYSNYQGKTIENNCVINFDLSHDWERLTESISGVIGQFRGYTAFIELLNVTGTLLFDNVEIVHTGLNWARDPFCNSIETSFTKAFYQIPKNWAPKEIISGAFYGSVYHGQS